MVARQMNIFFYVSNKKSRFMFGTKSSGWKMEIIWRIPKYKRWLFVVMTSSLYAPKWLWLLKFQLAIHIRVVKCLFFIPWPLELQPIMLNILVIPNGFLLECDAFPELIFNPYSISNTDIVCTCGYIKGLFTRSYVTGTWHFNF